MHDQNKIVDSDQEKYTRGISGSHTLLCDPPVFMDCLLASRFGMLETKCQALVQVQGLVQSCCTHQSDLPEKESLKRVWSQSSVYEDFIPVPVYFS